MHWIFASCVDAVRMGFLTKGDFSLRALAPSVTGGKKAILDLFLVKKMMKEHVLNVLMPQLLKTLSGNIVATIKDVLQSHQVYRARLHPYPQAQVLDDVNDIVTEPADSAVFKLGSPTSLKLDWKKGWPTSAERFLVFAESIIYGTEFDVSLKAGAKHRRSAEEILDYAQFKEKATQRFSLKNAEFVLLVSHFKLPMPKDAKAGSPCDS